MRLLLIDNYDSFTYNLYQLLCSLGPSVDVVRNDVIGIGNIDLDKYTGFMLSPGPGGPEDSGICLDLIQHFHKARPIMGICLGHQALAYAFGAQILRAPSAVHGKVSYIEHDGQGPFNGLSSPLKVARYHSLAVAEPTLPSVFQVHGRSTDGVVMSLAHRLYPLWGVQFHPESFLSDGGTKILQNFIDLCCLHDK